MKADQKVLDNLADAGCGAETIAAFARLAERNDGRGQLKLLDAHQRTLLAALHEDENKLNCLDYLMHRIREDKERLS